MSMVYFQINGCEYFGGTYVEHNVHIMNKGILYNLSCQKAQVIRERKQV